MEAPNLENTLKELECKKRFFPNVKGIPQLESEQSVTVTPLSFAL